MMEEPLEIRAGTETEPTTISGYALRFNSETKIGGWFREIIRQEAIPDDIQSKDVRALWNHNSDYPIGRTKNDTLKLEKDEKGLRFTVTPPDTSWGRDAMESVKRGDVSGMSFGFFVNRDKWTEETGKTPLRELLDVELLEVSPVTFPAYPQTTAKVRSAEEILSGKPLPPKGVEIEAAARQREIEIYELEAKI